MELMYFISGILVAGTTYATMLLRKNQSSYKDALARLQSYHNISSLREAEIGEELNDLKILIMDIQSSMEKDQYDSLSNINKKIGEIENLAKSTNNRLGEANKIFTKNASDAFSEIQQLKNNLKILGQDPNMLSRY